MKLKIEHDTHSKSIVVYCSKNNYIVSISREWDAEQTHPYHITLNDDRIFSGSFNICERIVEKITKASEDELISVYETNKLIWLNDIIISLNLGEKNTKIELGDKWAMVMGYEFEITEILPDQYSHDYIIMFLNSAFDTRKELSSKFLSKYYKVG